MIEITKENIWKTEYDIKKETYEAKRERKVLMIGLTLLSVVLAANLKIYINKTRSTNNLEREKLSRKVE